MSSWAYRRALDTAEADTLAFRNSAEWYFPEAIEASGSIWSAQALLASPSTGFLRQAQDRQDTAEAELLDSKLLHARMFRDDYPGILIELHTVISENYRNQHK